MNALATNDADHMSFAVSSPPFNTGHHDRHDVYDLWLAAGTVILVTREPCPACGLIDCWYVANGHGP